MHKLYMVIGGILFLSSAVIAEQNSSQNSDSMTFKELMSIRNDAGRAMFYCIQDTVDIFDDEISDATTIATALPIIIWNRTRNTPSLIKERYCNKSSNPEKCEYYFFTEEFPQLEKIEKRAEIIADIIVARSRKTRERENKGRH